MKRKKIKFSPKLQSSSLDDIKRFVPKNALDTSVISNYNTLPTSYQKGGLPKYQNAGLEKKIEVKPFVTSDLKEATKRTGLYNDSLYNYDLSQQHKEAAINKGLTPSPNKGTASTRSRSYENRHTRLGLGISDHFDKYKSFEGGTDLTGNKEYKGISTRENKRDSIPNRMDALDYELYRYAPTVGRTFGEIADVTSDTWALFANVLSGNNLELEGTNTTEHRYEAVPQYKKPTQPVIYKPETDIQESDFVDPRQLEFMLNPKKEDSKQKATTKEPSVIRPTITKVVKDAEGNIISTEEGISQKEAGRRFNAETQSWEKMRYGGLPKYQIAGVKKPLHKIPLKNKYAVPDESYVAPTPHPQLSQIKTKEEYQEEERKRREKIRDLNPLNWRKNISDINTTMGYGLDFQDFIDQAIYPRPMKSRGPILDAEANAFKVYMGQEQIGKNRFEPSPWKEGAYHLPKYAKEFPDHIDKPDEWFEKAGHYSDETGRGMGKENFSDFSGPTIKPYADLVFGRHGVKKVPTKDGGFYLQYNDEWDLDAKQLNIMNDDVKGTEFMQAMFGLDKDSAQEKWKKGKENLVGAAQSLESVIFNPFPVEGRVYYDKDNNKITGKPLTFGGNNRATPLTEFKNGGLPKYQNAGEHNVEYSDLGQYRKAMTAQKDSLIIHNLLKEQNSSAIKHKDQSAYDDEGNFIGNPYFDNYYHNREFTKQYDEPLNRLRALNNEEPEITWGKPIKAVAFASEQYTPQSYTKPTANPVYRSNTNVAAINKVVSAMEPTQVQEAPNDTMTQMVTDLEGNRYPRTTEKAISPKRDGGIHKYQIAGVKVTDPQDLYEDQYGNEFDVKDIATSYNKNSNARSFTYPESSYDRTGFFSSQEKGAMFADNPKRLFVDDPDKVQGTQAYEALSNLSNPDYAKGDKQGLPLHVRLKKGPMEPYKYQTGGAVVTDYDKNWDYKKEDGVVYTKRKDADKWISPKVGSVAELAIQSKVFGSPSELEKAVQMPIPEAPELNIAPPQAIGDTIPGVAPLPRDAAPRKKSPQVTIGDMLPDLPDLPDISLPDMPEFTGSPMDAIINSIGLPVAGAIGLYDKLRGIDLPDLPNISMPKVSKPDISIPDLPDLPDVSVPKVSLPNMPDVTLPKIQIPKVSIPDLPDMPDLPDVSMPDIEVPKVSLPDMPDISMPDMPDVGEFTGYAKDVISDAIESGQSSLSDLKNFFKGELIDYAEDFKETRENIKEGIDSVIDAAKDLPELLSSIADVEEEVKKERGDSGAPGPPPEVEPDVILSPEDAAPEETFEEMIVNAAKGLQSGHILADDVMYRIEDGEITKKMETIVGKHTRRQAGQSPTVSYATIYKKHWYNKDGSLRKFETPEGLKTGPEIKEEGLFRKYGGNTPTGIYKFDNRPMEKYKGRGYSSKLQALPGTPENMNRTYYTNEKGERDWVGSYMAYHPFPEKLKAQRAEALERLDISNELSAGCLQNSECDNRDMGILLQSNPSMADTLVILNPEMGDLSMSAIDDLAKRFDSAESEKEKSGVLQKLQALATPD